MRNETLTAEDIAGLQREIRALVVEVETMRAALMRRCTNCNREFMPKHFRQTLCAISDNVKCRRDHRFKMSQKSQETPI